MMKYRFIFILSFFLLFYHIKVNGQGVPAAGSTDCPNEKIFVHVSQECLFTGEVMFFKIYCTSSLFPLTEISSISFVEFVSSDNKPVMRKRILLDHGEGSGEFEIPGTISTGTYCLLVYTSWMKNFGEESFFRKNILIINPYQPLPPSAGIADTASIKGRSDLSLMHDNSVNLRTEKEYFSKREIIKIVVGQTDANNNPLQGLSVSVCRKGPSVNTISSGSGNPKHDDSFPTKIFLPDHKGMVMSGKLTDLSGEPKKNAALVLSFPGEGTNVKRTFTNALGEFNCLLNPGTGEEDIIFTLPDSETRLSMDESFWNGFRNPHENRPVYIPEDAVSYLKQAFYNFQLQKLFMQPAFERVTSAPVTNDSAVFYSKPYKTFILKNYLALDSIQEYFYELIPSVKFTKRRGGTEISVYDENITDYLRTRPGVFLDGVLLENGASILGIPVPDVDRITVLSSDYFYRDFEFGGIIDVHTKKSDFKSFGLQPDMLRLLVTKASKEEFRFLPADYSGSNHDKRKPDLRSLLFWEPWLKPEKKETAIQFWSGDVSGVYCITVSGITSGGNIVKCTKEIKIGN
jgi:hypothetical protein